MEPLIIRKAATNLYGLLILSVLSFIAFIYIVDFRRSTLLQFLLMAGIPIALIALPLFIYSLRELIRKPAQLTFTEEGLETRMKKFYPWKNMESISFSIEKVASDNAGTVYGNYITIQLNDTNLVKFPVSHLDRNPEDIMYLLKQFKINWDRANGFTHPG